MNLRLGKTALRVLVSVLLAAGLVIVGRVTAPTGSARAAGYRAGHEAGQYAGYFDGLRDGEAQGLREGRTVQAGLSVPAGSRPLVRRAFASGYRGGADDVFAGYDGGWALGQPYVVILEKGSGRIDYRILSRTPVKAGVDFFLCAGGRGLCQRVR